MTLSVSYTFILNVKKLLSRFSRLKSNNSEDAWPLLGASTAYMGKKCRGPTMGWPTVGQMS